MVYGILKIVKSFLAVFKFAFSLFSFFMCLTLYIFSMLMIMNRLKDDPFLSFHDSVVFLDDQLFCAFAVQFRLMILFLLKLFLDVSDQKILAE